VHELADENCALLLWTTCPQLPVALNVLDAWGFDFKTVGFCWTKTNPKSGTFFMGMGNHTRANAELCLLGLKGRMVRMDAGVSSLVVAPRGRHSEKPAEVRDRIVRLYGDVPRIELFARQRVEGWAAWGDEVESDAELVDGHFAVREHVMGAPHGQHPAGPGLAGIDHQRAAGAQGRTNRGHQPG
jgi:N6-adenosine-specific RNA methylase IME4